MGETNARTVADYLIWFSREHGDPISNLKLQKLLYYAQAWFLALYDVPLFDDAIEAWVHGPAVPRVYGAFKHCTWQPIGIDVQKPELSAKVIAHLNEIMDVYGELTAFHLERLTHSEPPWQKARGGLAPDAMSRNVISTEDMKQYYRSVAKENDHQAG